MIYVETIRLQDTLKHEIITGNEHLLGKSRERELEKLDNNGENEKDLKLY